MGVEQKKHQRGESITSLVRSIRRLDEYETWKRQVFLRDRFTCQHCGARNGRKRVIEAHHLVELSALVRQQGITSTDQAKTCSSLWSVDNGQTLCHTCHTKTDSYPQNLLSNAKQHTRRATKKSRRIRN